MNVLYTIVPPEAIFGPDESADGDKGTAAEMIIDGVSIIVEPLGPGRGRVQRIISTNPQNYLDRRWQPGETVYW